DDSPHGHTSREPEERPHPTAPASDRPALVRCVGSRRRHAYAHGSASGLGMHDRTLRWLIVGLLAAPQSSCHRLRQDEWDVPPPTSARSAVAAPLVAERAGAEVDAVARGLFAKTCATCHGLDGSGQGPSVLDRPARNFKDGGFSFGNTADAIFNTISSGIPGTPMPAFADAL